MMKHSEVWEIDNFSWLSRETKVLRSRTFIAGAGEWRIKLFPFGDGVGSGAGGAAVGGAGRKASGGVLIKNNEEFVSVYLQLVGRTTMTTTTATKKRKSSASFGIRSSFSFFVLDASGAVLWSQKSAGYSAKERRFCFDASNGRSKMFGYRQFLSRSRFNIVFPPAGKLTLRCDLKIGKTADDEESITTTTRDFSCLFDLVNRDTTEEAEEEEDKKVKLADIGFVVDGIEIKAHKTILSKRSKAFKDLFDSFPDRDRFAVDSAFPFDLRLSEDALKDTLRWIYADTPTVLTAPFNRFRRLWSLNVERLATMMIAGRNYKMSDLVAACESKLIQVFRLRSKRTLCKCNLKRNGKATRDEDFFHFDDKPFALDKMAGIASLVSAARLGAYLESCRTARRSE